MGNGPSRIVEQQLTRHHQWIGIGNAAHTNDEPPQEDVVTALSESSLMLGRPADLHTLGSPWINADEPTAVAAEPPVQLEAQDVAQADSVRRLIFSAAAAPSTKSECAHRLVFPTNNNNNNNNNTTSASTTTTSAAASTDVAPMSTTQAVFRAWQAIDRNDHATLSTLVDTNRLPTRPVGATVEVRVLERRMLLLQELISEMSDELTLLRDLRRSVDVNPVIYAIDAGAMSCIDALLDAGIGFTSRKMFNVELASVVRMCTPMQAARMLANAETNLLHLEQSFLRTKQRGDGPFPFFPMRTMLEEAFSFDQMYRRNQLYFLIERYRAARARNALCAVANADPGIVAFVECMLELPQLCRALVVQYSVCVAPPPPETRRFVVALDTVRVWMRSVILADRVEPDGKRSVFITYENWDSRYDEWILEDSDRLRPWVHPRLRAVAESGDFLPSEAVVANWLKRSGL